MVLLAPSLLRTFLSLMPTVTETDGWTPSGKLSADGGLGAPDETCNLGLLLAGTDQHLNLIPLAAGKMGHTVGGERIKRLPSYRTKDFYAFEISVRGYGE